MQRCATWRHLFAEMNCESCVCSHARDALARVIHVGRTKVANLQLPEHRKHVERVSQCVSRLNCEQRPKFRHRVCLLVPAYRAMIAQIGLCLVSERFTRHSSYDRHNRLTVATGKLD